MDRERLAERRDEVAYVFCDDTGGTGSIETCGAGFMMMTFG
jgi:hypothetical protein